MFVRPTTHPAQRGQMIVLMALTLTVSVLMVGLVIDGGTALAQRRAAQNASDFAALAGARIVAESIGGDALNGTDRNVELAIANAVASNGGTPMTFGAPNGPRYVDRNGALLAFVGSERDPVRGPSGSGSGRPGAGRRTSSASSGSRAGPPAADATAKGGYADGGPGGTLFPVGIAENFFKTFPFCSDDKISTTPGDDCYPQHLTPGTLNVPGGFGWLKFGCDGYGLGQDRPGQRRRMRRTRSRSWRARSGRRRTATAAVRRSVSREASTGSATCPGTRSPPIARTTSTTGSR